MRLPQCPHVVRFHEAFWEAPGQTLLLMLEYGDAGDLEEYIQSRRAAGLKQPTEQEAMRIFVQVRTSVPSKMMLRWSFEYAATVLHPTRDPPWE